MQGKRNCVHKFCGVRHEGKECNTKEFFIDPRALEHHIHHVNKYLCEMRVVQVGSGRVDQSEAYLQL